MKLDWRMPIHKLQVADDNGKLVFSIDVFYLLM